MSDTTENLIDHICTLQYKPFLEVQLLDTCACIQTYCAHSFHIVNDVSDNSYKVAIQSN